MKKEDKIFMLSIVIWIAYGIIVILILKNKFP